jgi:hypothetical protein
MPIAPHTFRRCLALPAAGLLAAALLIPSAALAHRSPTPSVATTDASRVLGSSATLNGTLNPHGTSVNYHFQYGSTKSYGARTRTVTLRPGTSAVRVHAVLRKLVSGRVYHYRLLASNAIGTRYGSDALLVSRTPFARRMRTPSVSTTAVSSLSSASATLNGTVDPNGPTASYHFQYGTSTSYGSSTPTVSVKATSAVTVRATLGSLSATRQYHYRLVAANSHGTSDSPDASFTTTAVVVPVGTTPGVPTPAPPATPTASSTYDAAVLADHPVGFWDMHPGLTETDLTGNGHLGTYKGGTPASAALPNGDSASDFNGSSEYLTIPSSPAFSIPTTQELTWEAWIRPDELQFAHPANSDGYVDWMGKCASYSPSCEWEARMYSSTTSESRPNRLSAYVFNGSAGLGSGADWQPNSGLIQAGKWLFVVGEYDTNSSATPAGCSADGSQPGSINIWVDGVLWNEPDHFDTGCMSQYGITPTASGSPVNIGTMATDSWFPGAVGKVAIYNTLLSQAEINTQYTAMTGTNPSGSCGNFCTIPTQ